MNRPRTCIVVPRLVDAENNNAQCLNARAMLSRFGTESAAWYAVYHGKPDPKVVANPRVHLSRLWRRRLWQPGMVLHYLRRADALFYPGIEWMDAAGTALAARVWRKRPVIATLEGIAGTGDREKALSRWAGHDVPCQPVPPRVQDRIDSILKQADHIIAISQFLARMGRHLYGDKFSVQSLGIDAETFFAGGGDGRRARPLVLTVGTVTARKRPEVMLGLASAIPEADFLWLGAGPSLEEMRIRARESPARNVHFPGPASPSAVATWMRTATVFALPSLSEGVPKVAQEAAACGLPVVLFGQYEAPTVVDDENGFVVWTDEAFQSRVRELVEDGDKARRLGARGAEMALEWAWDVVAPRWERLVLERARRT